MTPCSGQISQDRMSSFAKILVEVCPSSTSLACVNWQVDLAILGLERETDFSVQSGAQAGGPCHPGAGEGHRLQSGAQAGQCNASLTDFGVQARNFINFHQIFAQYVLNVALH